MEIGSIEYYNKQLDELLLDLHEWTDYKFAVLNTQLNNRFESIFIINCVKELGCMPINMQSHMVYHSRIKELRR